MTLKLLLKITIMILAIMAIGGIVILSISWKNIGSKMVGDIAVSSAKESLGADLSFSSIGGNPLTGFKINGLELKWNGRSIASAASCKIGISLMDAMKGRPGLESVYLEGVSADYEGLKTFIESQEKASSSNIPIKHIEIADSVLSSQWGNLALHHADIEVSSGSFICSIRIDFRGIYSEGTLDFNRQGETLSVKGEMTSSGRGVVAFSGEILPEPKLAGKIEISSFDELSDVFLDKNSINITGSGESSFEFSLKSGNICISGDVETKELVLGDLVLGRIKGEYIFSNGNLEARIAQAEFFGSEIEGNILIDFVKENTPGRMNMKIRNADLSKWSKMVENIPKEFSGSIPEIDISAAGELKEQKIKFYAAFADSVINGQRVRKAKTNAAVTLGGDISFSGSAEWLDSPVLFTGDIRNIAKGDISLNLEAIIKSMDISKLKNINRSLDNPFLKGFISVELFINSSSGKIIADGRILSVKSSGQPNAIEDCNMIFNMKDNILKISDASWKIAGAPFDVNGYIKKQNDTWITNINGKFSSFKAKNLNLLSSALSKYGLGGDISGAWTIEGETTTPSVRFDIYSASVANNLKINLVKPRVSGRYRDGLIEIISVNSEISGGNIAGAGTVNLRDSKSAKFDIKGDINSIEISRLLKSSGVPISADGVASGKIAISGTADKPEITLSLAAKEINISSSSIRNPMLKIKISSSGVLIENISAEMMKGTIRGTGALDISELKKPKGNIRFSAKNIGLDGMKGMLPVLRGKDIVGALNIDGSISGAYPSVKLVMNLKSSEVSIQGIGLTDISGSCSGDLNAVDISAHALLYGSALTLSAKVNPMAPSESLRFSIKGDDIALETLTPRLGYENIFSGKVSVSVDGLVRDGKPDIDGYFKSEILSMNGLKVKDMAIPFSMNGDMLAADKATVDVYGGKISAKASFKPSTGDWSISFKMISFDIAPAVDDFIKSSGDISGKLNLNVAASGRLGLSYLTKGSGYARISEGKISGFSALKSLESAGGEKEIRYSSMSSNFELDGEGVYILPGSRILAPAGDSIYRYFAADGEIRFNKRTLNLNCMGEVNIKAFNAVLGALEGLINATESAQSLLKDIISGLLGGLSMVDFREVSFKMSGPWESPGMNNLTVSPKQSLLTPPNLDDNDQTKDRDNFRVTIKFPVGDGVASGDDVGDQLKEQLIDQIIKQIVTNQ